MQEVVEIINYRLLEDARNYALLLISHSSMRRVKSAMSITAMMMMAANVASGM